MKPSRGFITLIELLIIAAIIGILLAVAYPAYKDYTQKGITEKSSNVHPKKEGSEKRSSPIAAPASEEDSHNANFRR